MRESLDLPNMSDYVPIKEAAKMLGVSDKRVYAYVEDGRLPAVRAAHIIMIPVQEVKKFKPAISGRPRKNTPGWRVSPADNLLLTTSVFVQVKTNQLKKLQQRLEDLRLTEEHTFPGTVARYIISSKTHPEKLEILLIWRSGTIPDATVRQRAFETLQKSLDDVLDWSSAQYDEGEILIHT